MCYRDWYREAPVRLVGLGRLSINLRLKQLMLLGGLRIGLDVEVGAR